MAALKSKAAPTAAATGTWNRLKGKTVRFEGTRYEFRVRERLLLLARTHGATIATAITPKVDYLVVPDAGSPPSGVKSKVNSLNSKGAAIQLMDADDFARLVAPTVDEAIEVIRRGKNGLVLNNEALDPWTPGVGLKPVRTISGQSFKGLDLSNYDFEQTAFDKCDFTAAKLDHARFVAATNCTFDKCTGKDARFGDVTGSTFRAAKLPDIDIYEQSDRVDFTGAQIEDASFNQYGWLNKEGKMSGMIFRNARMKSATFSDDCKLVAPDFEGADAPGASWYGGGMESPNFRKANLSGANLSGVPTKNADFTGANLRGAAFVDADLTGAKFDGADVAGCNFGGAKTAGVNFAKARGFKSGPKVIASAGPALLELNKAVARAKRIQFSFKLDKPVAGARENHARADQISGDTSSLRWGGGVDVPIFVPSGRRRGSRKAKMSDELLAAARAVGEVKIKLETLEIKTTKSKLKGNDLRQVFIRALCEAFGQEPPDEEKLAAEAKVHRAAARKVKEKQSAKWKKEREKWAKQEAAAKQKAAAKVEQKVVAAVGGKVADLESFMKALAVRADKEKIKKATAMLKAEKFQLFNDIADDHMAGVVKSQTDPDLVYACRITGDGHFGCCTQNLNVCGGLRGSVCKHLLVLIIGLVQAGKLDPATIDGWIASTGGNKPELDREKMGEIFVRYKGAEAGEIDWRPTETVPEDYYAL